MSPFRPWSKKDTQYADTAATTDLGLDHCFCLERVLLHSLELAFVILQHLVFQVLHVLAHLALFFKAVYIIY
ncbi:hypothetical protein ACRRTK_006998 [Alexandromys fortis]